MHDVFISYARENSAQVKRLVDVFISARGWSIWWDARLRAGEQFTREIQEALTSTRCVVVVWSSHSVDSDWVMAEASDGWERGILIPVRLDECQPPVPFRQTETANLTSWRGTATDPAVLSLLESIERVLARHTQPGASELQARERRRRVHIRRRLGRRVAMAVGGVLLGALVWFSYERLQSRHFAESLAQQADTLRTQVLTPDAGKETKLWWWLLMEDQERLDRLELSVLLATEAFKRASTERTERSLRAGLALLPRISIFRLILATTSVHSPSVMMVACSWPVQPLGTRWCGISRRTMLHHSRMAARGERKAGWTNAADIATGALLWWRSAQ